MDDLKSTLTSPLRPPISRNGPLTAAIEMSPKLPYMARGPDWWIAVLTDPNATFDQRCVAAKALERFRDRDIDAAWRRKNAAEIEALEAELTPEELDAVIREPLTEGERGEVEEEVKELTKSFERDRMLKRKEGR